eukprot:6463990-Amphidinium_carterae.1
MTAAGTQSEITTPTIGFSSPTLNRSGRPAPPSGQQIQLCSQSMPQGIIEIGVSHPAVLAFAVMRVGMFCLPCPTAGATQT